MSVSLSSQEQARDTRSIDEQAIRAADAEMLKALRAKDLNPLMSFYAYEASFFPLEEPIATGRRTIHATWAHYLAIPGFANPRWQLTKVEISRSGDLAYTQGTYETSLEEVQGKSVTDRGKWVDVWKKQPDGVWKIVADISNPDSQGAAALWEAEYGNFESARQAAAATLAGASSQTAKILAALALAELKDISRTEAIGRELSQQFPADTMLNNVWLPSIRAQIEISRGNPEQAIKILQAVQPYDLMQQPPRPSAYPIYVRGQAYLRAQQGSAAAAEFQKILDHRGLTGILPLKPLAYLGVALARTMSGDAADARTAYQDFLALWKDADPDIPILIVIQNDRFLLDS
jgi:ketosteroid isomerase-like protein